MRAGCEQFVCEPIDAADLANAVGRVSSKRLFVRKKSKCICVVGSSGGAGATSIACNLALEIGHMTDKQCALADLDLQFGDVATNFDWEPKYSIHDLAESIGGLDASVLTSTLSVLQCKVSLLARPQRVEQAEQVTPDVVHRVIELLAFTHEYIVVDVPRRIDGSTTAALGQADVVIVVCQLLVPSIRNAKRLVDTLADGGIPRERMEIVVNRCDSGSGRITTKDVEELIKPVYATIPNDYQFVARSLDFGRPAAALDRNNPVRKAIRGIARKITAEPADETKGQERKGFLDRLLSR
jgi:pilus assembly protein CpaE